MNFQSIVNQGIKAINTLKQTHHNIDNFERRHFGDLDEKLCKRLDVLYDKTGIAIAVSAKSVKDWTHAAQDKTPCDSCGTLTTNTLVVNNKCICCIDRETHNDIQQP